MPRNASAIAPSGDAVTDFGAGVLYKLDCIEQLLRDILLDSEQEPDFDTAYIVGGTVGAASVQIIGPLPRTLKHVEIDLALTAVGGPIALLDGNYTLAQAQGMVNLAGTVGQANAVAVSGGGEVTVRDYLGGSGYLTVLFAAAFTGFVQVRIRQLDATQARAQVT